MPQCGMADKPQGDLAVDLDATLAKREEPFSIYSIGEPVPEILQAVKDQIATGRHVIIFTARASSNDPGVMRMVREWLTRHGLGELKITAQKLPSFTEFWDDRAKPVTPDKGFTEKEAMQMVRKTRMVEQHDDHCPHCDHKFHEKGYPRPDHAQAEREGIDVMEADELCPNCGGIVDSPEMTDEEIDKTIWGGDDFKQSLRDQRQRKRDRIAARGTQKTSGKKRTAVLVTGNPKYIADNPKAEEFYNALELMLSRAGYQTSRDPGLPHTEPAVADLWVGHSRGMDRLRWAPSSTATLRVDDYLDPSHLDPVTGEPTDKHFEITDALRARLAPVQKVPLDDLLQAAREKSPQSSSAPPAISEEAKEASRRDGLRNLWLRKGQCPKCGGLPESTTPDDAGDVECSKCHWLWELALGKTAADVTETVPKPLKHFSRPENWDPYDKLGDVELLCGSNDWECANTWLWAEGDGQRVWIELKFPKNHPCFEKYTDADEAEWKAHADAAKKAWLAAAKARKTKSAGYTIDSFEAALGDPDMKPFIAASGTDKLRVKEASAAPPTTGPHALVHALQSLDLDALEKEAREHIASGKITRRDKGVKMLNVLQGLKRNNIAPQDLMITRVPVLPAAFRPYAMMGSTYIPGAANELYSDLFKHKAIHEETVETLGEGGAGLTRRNLYGAVRALYGYGDPVSPKLLQRGTQGYLHEITGDSPKFGFVNRRLVSKPIDSVGRSVITVNPELDMNQIGIPEEMAWDMLGSLVQRRLSRTGMPLAATIKHVKDRSREARQALDQELKERPVIYSRSPAWHKFNTIAGYAQIHGGNDVQISPYVTAGHNADFDGDQINVNFPIMPASVQEAKDKLMPDKMLFTIKDPEATMALPKHEMLLSLAAAASRPSLRHHVFASRAEALDGIKRNNVKLEDSVEFPD